MTFHKWEQALEELLWDTIVLWVHEQWTGCGGQTQIDLSSP